MLFSSRKELEDPFEVGLHFLIDAESSVKSHCLVQREAVVFSEVQFVDETRYFWLLEMVALVPEEKLYLVEGEEWSSRQVFEEFLSKLVGPLVFEEISKPLALFFHSIW